MRSAGLGLKAAAYERLISTTDDVVNHGRVSPRELAREMLSAGVWVHPSWDELKDTPWEETSCIGAMEAQCAGLRIVCGGWGALVETVKEGVQVGGRDWRDHFVEVVAGEISATDQSRIEEMAVACERFSWSAVAEQWEAVMVQ
jgi:glycosyltransferase involved in cell wall biosynthesis